MWGCKLVKYAMVDLALSMSLQLISSKAFGWIGPAHMFFTA